MEKLIWICVLIMVSKTVQTDDAPPEAEFCETTGDNCVSSCVGMPDGDYQSCRGCHIYISCSNEIAIEDRPCAPGGLFWDDVTKTCETTSETCAGCELCLKTGPTCITSCAGLSDGNYQSCDNCDQYHSCVGGLMYPNRPCATKDLMWNDNTKECDWASDTCKQCVDPNLTAP